MGKTRRTKVVAEKEGSTVKKPIATRNAYGEALLELPDGEALHPPLAQPSHDPVESAPVDQELAVEPHQQAALDQEPADALHRGRFRTEPRSGLRRLAPPQRREVAREDEGKDEENRQKMILFLISNVPWVHRCMIFISGRIF